MVKTYRSYAPLKKRANAKKPIELFFANYFQCYP